MRGGHVKQIPVGFLRMLAQCGGGENLHRGIGQVEGAAQGFVDAQNRVIHFYNSAGLPIDRAFGNVLGAQHRLIRWALEGTLLSDHVHRNPDPFTRFELLAEDGRLLSDGGDFLYLATPGTFCTAADRVDGSGLSYTFLIAGDSPALAPYREREEFNILTAALSYSALCNRMVRLEHAYDDWRNRLSRALYAEASLNSLLCAGASLLPADLLYLDISYRVVGSARTARCPVFDAAEDAGQLSDEQLRELVGSTWQAGAGWLCCLSPVQAEGQLVGYLAPAVPEQVGSALASELRDQMVDALQTFMSRYYQEQYASSNLLTVFMCDLLDGKLSDQEELVLRARQLPLPLKNRYYHLVVVEPDDPTMANSPHFLSGLAKCFASDIVAAYRGRILVVASKKRGDEQIAYDLQGLEALLEQYNAVACISNHTQWLTALRPLYVQTQGAIQFARIYCEDPSRRVFRSEDYAMAQIIDLCARHCQDYFHDDLRYLCHAGIVSLKDYDDKHQTDYCALLKYYLMNDRKTVQTAQAFYMHRNTLQSRIEKIARIVGEDFEDPQIRQRLLFSIQVLEYMRTCLKQENLYGKKQHTAPTFHRLGGGPDPGARIR